MVATDEAFTEILTSVEVDLFEVGELESRRLDQRLGRGAAEALVDVGVQASRRSRRCGSARHGRAPRAATSLISSGLRRLPGLRRSPWTPASSAASAISTWKWMSATIGHRRARDDLGQSLGGGLFVAGAAHDVRAVRGERVDLLERPFDVGRLGRGHRLHRDRCVAAHLDRADGDLTGLACGGSGSWR